MKKVASKKCKSCNRIFPSTTEYFHKHKLSPDGLRYSCKDCRNTLHIEQLKNSQRLRNLAALRKREYRKRPKGKETTKRYKEYYRQLKKSKEYMKQYLKSYRQRPEVKNKYNKDYWNDIIKKKWNTDENYKMLSRLRNRIFYALKAQSAIKSYRTFELIGCSIKELKISLERQFKKGMSWDNYGEWHIDHIKPCVSFDLVDSEQQKQCFHYSNLQPLWAEENMLKGAKLL